MTLVHALLRLADKAVPALPTSRLPTFYEGKVIWPSRQLWRTTFTRYEPHMTAALKRHLRPGMTCWDIGANVGWLSLYAASLVGPPGQVLCFEPAPEVFALLAENVSCSLNVRAIHCGVGNADTLASFAAQGRTTSASFVEAVTKINESYLPTTPIEAVDVTLKRGDTLLAEFGPPDLVKVDVEGFEYEVLRGSAALLAQGPTLLLEIHPPQLRLSGATEDDVFKVLRQHGYEWTVIDRNNNSLYTIEASVRSGLSTCTCVDGARG